MPCSRANSDVDLTRSDAHLAANSGGRLQRKERPVGRPSKYPDECRSEAIELVRSSGRSIADVARSLGISDAALRDWLSADREARARAADPRGLSDDEREDLKRL
jgi:transposase